MVKKLSRMPYAQACVRIYNDGTTVLQSYATDVIVIDSDGVMTVNGLYSRTTIRHISAFMAEYGHGATYYTAKALYLNGDRMNIYTGEIL